GADPDARARARRGGLRARAQAGRRPDAADTARRRAPAGARRRGGARRAGRRRGRHHRHRRPAGRAAARGRGLPGVRLRARRDPRGGRDGAARGGSRDPGGDRRERRGGDGAVTGAPQPLASPHRPAPPVSMAATVDTRRGLLALFGLIEILVGAACFGLLAVQFVMWVYFSRLAAAESTGLVMSNLALATLVYAAGAAFFVTMGVGTIY